LDLPLRQSPAPVQLPLRIAGATSTHVAHQILNSESLPLERRSQKPGDTQRLIKTNPLQAKLQVSAKIAIDLHFKQGLHPAMGIEPIKPGFKGV